MNALLCIGCNTYDYLTALEGAEKDARDVFDLLCVKSGDYQSEFSLLLSSPTQSEIKEALSRIIPAGIEIGVLTFFFAGHAAVKKGSFYLCVKESNFEQLSLTAYPITALFAIASEVQPRQVNIVVDACEAGGSSFDLAQLIKPEVIGHSEASSITFLGACSSDQVAGETPDGGILTRYLVKCLTGETQIQTKSPSLDLIDISTSVCRDVRKNHPRQKPISWGLSLFGNGYFSQNPHFDSGTAEPRFSVASIPPNSDIGKSIRLNSSAIWNEYRAIKDDPNPRRLLDLLDTVFQDINRDSVEIVTSVQGLARTLSVGAGESVELLAPSQCLATCAVFFLPSIESEMVKKFIKETLREIMILDMAVWNELLSSVKLDQSALLNSVGVVADLYYLPMRITKILGWIGSSIIAGLLIPALNDGNDVTRFTLASALLDCYAGSIVAVSDEQAPFLYVFLKACLLKDQTDLAKRVATLYFASFADKKGNITRVGVDGIQAFHYIQSLGPEEYRPSDWRKANPSHLLPVLLYFGAKLHLGEIWDLRALDRINSAFFIPANYRDFGRKVIGEGMNYTHQIGFGLWSLPGFIKEFERGIAEGFSTDTHGFCKEGAALCAIASLLFPNRLPLVLECALQ